MSIEKPSLLTFPCDFSIKIFGEASDQFELAVLSIIKAHVKDLAENAMVSRSSKEGKYQAITITVPVNSQAELDDIYRELTAHPLVLMAL